MECRAPGTLKEWVDLYIENGWAEPGEALDIVLDLFPDFGPKSLDLIIKKAQEQKEEFELGPWEVKRASNN